ncbi:MAG TPA: DUF983 domain-containing protein [Gemmatimonadales bacterium]|nr:DUF983 domain-containing protein [Gemmatimonadales bacterium]
MTTIHAPVLPALPPRKTMFARALRRRCPVCGAGPLFQGWFRMKDHCPRCGIRTRRGEDGYTLGALWFNLFLAESITTAIFVTTLIRTWPDPPWGWLQIAGPVEAVVIPLLVWPFARTLFLAFDLCFRPLEPKDLT